MCSILATSCHTGNRFARTVEIAPSGPWARPTAPRTGGLEVAKDQPPVPVAGMGYVFGLPALVFLSSSSATAASQDGCV